MYLKDATNPTNCYSALIALANVVRDRDRGQNKVPN